MRRIFLMYPSLLRIGFLSALAYRAEFLVWVLTTNLPLINLALWSAVARDHPVGGYGQPQFAAYFLATLIVRLLTGCWLVWELTMEIRQGTLAMRLLRPVHPLVSFSAENLAAVPMRAVVSLPIAIVLLLAVGTDHVTQDPVMWAAIPVLILGAWIMTYLVMALVGSAAFFLDSAQSLYEVWLGLFTVFSGYLVPLDLFPLWLQKLAYVLPFRLMLGLPVEAITGRLTHEGLVSGLCWQAAYLVAIFLAVRTAWNAGVRRYSAFGG
jgi:ABC-2 type transport system permease protein